MNDLDDSQAGWPCRLLLWEAHGLSDVGAETNRYVRMLFSVILPMVVNPTEKHGK